MLLADRDTRLFLESWVVSEIGSRITREGLMVVTILAAGATSIDLGWLAMLAAVPGLLVGPAAGSFIDSRQRRPVMIAADAVRALCLVSIPSAALFRRFTFAQFAVVTLLTATASVIFRVADRAYLPSLVGRTGLTEGNRLLGFADAILASPATTPRKLSGA